MKILFLLLIPILSFGQSDTLKADSSNIHITAGWGEDIHSGNYRLYYVIADTAKKSIARMSYGINGRDSIVITGDTIHLVKQMSEDLLLSSEQKDAANSLLRMLNLNYIYTLVPDEHREAYCERVLNYEVLANKVRKQLK